jgi:hypothetical protein
LLISRLLLPGEFSQQAGDSTVRDAHDLRRHRASRENNRDRGGNRSHYRPVRGARKTSHSSKEDKGTQRPVDCHESPDRRAALRSHRPNRNLSLAVFAASRY